MSVGKPLVWLGVAACLVLVGRCSSPRPSQPSRDSTRLAQTARTVDTVVQTVTQTVERLDTVIRWRERRSPPQTPPRPDSVAPDVASLYARISYDSQTIAVLDSALSSVRDTLASVRSRLAPVPAVLDFGANRIGRLERRKPPSWAIGPTVGTGGVGGYLSHDMRVLVPLQVVVQVEGGSVRAGVGVRF